MARRKAGVNWYHDTLTPTLAKFSVTANVAIKAAAERLADEMKEWAQANAPWNDRTGDARAGLDTDVDSQGFRQTIYLYHTVEYGLWLEVRWNGRYAIIIPTLEHFDRSRVWTHFGGVMGAATLGRLRGLR